MFLPGESQERGSLVGCRLWGRTESDTTEATQQQQQQPPVSLGAAPFPWGLCIWCLHHGSYTSCMAAQDSQGAKSPNFLSLRSRTGTMSFFHYTLLDRKSQTQPRFEAGGRWDINQYGCQETWLTVAAASQTSTPHEDYMTPCLSAPTSRQKLFPRGPEQGPPRSKGLGGGDRRGSSPNTSLEAWALRQFY